MTFIEWQNFADSQVLRINKLSLGYWTEIDWEIN